MSEIREFRGSSVVKTATYDPEARILTIDFRNGNTSMVKNVSANEWRSFKLADSPGAFVNSRFRDRS